MIVGASNSISFFNLLFLLIILRYKSFKSELANFPFSSCTSGLSSGGNTGSIVINNQLGFNLFFLKNVNIFICFKIVVFFFSLEIFKSFSFFFIKSSSFCSICSKKSFSPFVPVFA